MVYTTIYVMVTVFTCRGAGTDANVYIEMFGDKACVGKSQLESHGNNFERGQVRHSTYLRGVLIV